MKKLYRSETDKVIAGVCAGIGEYLDIDPVLVRILFVVFTLAGGAGIVLYFLLWVLLPTKGDVAVPYDQSLKKNGEEIKQRATSVAASLQDHKNKQVWGWLVIFIGAFLLLSNLGAFGWFRIQLLWPILIIVLGIIVIFKR
jgi:phage shock protein C